MEGEARDTIVLEAVLEAVLKAFLEAVLKAVLEAVLKVVLEVVLKVVLEAVLEAVLGVRLGGLDDPMIVAMERKHPLVAMVVPRLLQQEQAMTCLVTATSRTSLPRIL